MSARYLRGNVNPLMLTIATGKAVAVGDLVGLSSNTIVKASDTTWDTNLATTQTAFVALFAGLSGQTKTAVQARPYGNSEDNLIRVDTSGEFEVDLLTGAQLKAGDLIGPAKHASNNALLDDYYVKVTNEAYAVGTVVRDMPASGTKVQIRVRSTLFPLSK